MGHPRDDLRVLRDDLRTLRDDWRVLEWPRAWFLSGSSLRSLQSSLRSLPEVSHHPSESSHHPSLCSGLSKNAHETVKILII